MSLGNRVRKLIARIQKEIDYPRVYRATCHIPVNVAPLGLNIDAEVIPLPRPTAKVKPLKVVFEIEVHEERLAHPDVHQVEPLYDMEAQVHQIPCDFKAKVGLNHPTIPFPPAALTSLSIPRIRVRIHRPPVKVHPRRPLRVPVLPPAYVHSNLPLALKLPIMLPIQPMGSLPKRLQIRYRATVLKLLQIPAGEVTFAGVCFGVPPMPLKSDGYLKDDKLVYALANYDGEVNPFQKRKVWVVLQKVSDGDFLRVPINEE